MTVSERDASADGSSLCAALADPRRRHVLQVLSDAESPVELTRLANEVATRENGTPIVEVPMARIKELQVGLYHTHVPKLADIGIVTYDECRRTVSMTDEQEARVTRLLDRVE